MAAQVSPLITNMSWGSITVQVVDKDGKISPSSTSVYRDAKLWPGGSCAWDWTETGTGHWPGVQPADVDKLVEQKPDVIVLSRGVLYMLQIPQSTQQYIKQKLPNVQLVIEQSKQARETYNTRAAQGEKVAALIHTTC